MSEWDALGLTAYEAKRPLLDRIEELEAKLATCEKYRDAYDKMGRIGTEAYRDLEAKLAKAVEALEKLARLGNGDRYGNSDGNMIARATLATLAELKGGK